jgi:hypothetical protein
VKEDVFNAMIELSDEELRELLEDEEEVRRLHANKDALINIVLNKTAQWADGVAIYKQQKYYLVNVKRANNNNFYTKKTWRIIDFTDGASNAYIIAAAGLCNDNAVVITKDKKILCTSVKEKGEYIFFEEEPKGVKK